MGKWVAVKVQDVSITLKSSVYIGTSTKWIALNFSSLSLADCSMCIHTNFKKEKKSYLNINDLHTFLVCTSDSNFPPFPNSYPI